MYSDIYYTHLSATTVNETSSTVNNCHCFFNSNCHLFWRENKLTVIILVVVCYIVYKIILHYILDSMIYWYNVVTVYTGIYFYVHMIIIMVFSSLYWYVWNSLCPVLWHTNMHDTSNFFILGPLHWPALGDTFLMFEYECIHVPFTLNSTLVSKWKKHWLDNAVCKHCTYYHILVCHSTDNLFCKLGRYLYILLHTSIYNCTYIKSGQICQDSALQHRQDLLHSFFIHC